jgi:hypothetical protein
MEDGLPKQVFEAYSKARAKVEAAEKAREKTGGQAMSGAGAAALLAAALEEAEVERSHFLLTLRCTALVWVGMPFFFFLP